MYKYNRFIHLHVLGLGTSTSKEAKEYFSDMTRHKIDFRYQGAEDDASIVLVLALIYLEKLSRNKSLNYLIKPCTTVFENIFLFFH